MLLSIILCPWAPSAGSSSNILMIQLSLKYYPRVAHNLGLIFGHFWWFFDIFWIFLGIFWCSSGPDPPFYGTLLRWRELWVGYPLKTRFLPKKCPKSAFSLVSCIGFIWTPILTQMALFGDFGFQKLNFGHFWKNRVFWWKIFWSQKWQILRVQKLIRFSIKNWSIFGFSWYFWAHFGQFRTHFWAFWAIFGEIWSRREDPKSGYKNTTFCKNVIF